MKSEVTTQGQAVVVAFAGDIDLENSPKARQTLLDCVGKSGKVVVDLSGVGYIDSSGIACLVEAYQAARKKSASFALAAVSESTLRVLKLARLDKVFTITPTVEAAAG